MAVIIVKNSAFGVLLTQMCLFENKCIHNRSLFGMDFGLQKYLFENEPGLAVIVIGARYQSMMIQFIDCYPWNHKNRSFHV